jgi:DNA (cytosine-5)-methyltransferase 1
MTCGHLFNGISGFGLAAHWMGWENYMHCEIDPFCNRVMRHHFPKSILHEDIRKTDFSIYRGQIGLLTGGFPCQPFSDAGLRKGTEDPRHLWPENFRAVREIRPPWFVGENVRGLTNWNKGMVFHQVQADLESAGYEVIPFLLPAAGVNAPHQRYRIWFIAYCADARIEGVRSGWQNAVCEPGVVADTERHGYNGNEIASQGQQSDGGRTAWNQSSSSGLTWPSSHSQGIGKRESADKTNTLSESRETWVKPFSIGGGGATTDTPGIGRLQTERKPKAGQFDKTDWKQFPTQSPICSRNDGIPAGLVPVSVPGRRGRRTLTGKQAYARIQKESIKAAGNAIVPQVALMIFKAIEQYDLQSAAADHGMDRI